jgi:hypothetical protein
MGIGMGIGMDLRLGLDLRSMFGFRVESRSMFRIEAWLCLQVSTILGGLSHTQRNGLKMG